MFSATMYKGAKRPEKKVEAFLYFIYGVFLGSEEFYKGNHMQVSFFAYFA